MTCSRKTLRRKGIGGTFGLSGGGCALTVINSVQVADPQPRAVFRRCTAYVLTRRGSSELWADVSRPSTLRARVRASPEGWGLKKLCRAGGGVGSYRYLSSVVDGVLTAQWLTSASMAPGRALDGGRTYRRGHCRSGAKRAAVGTGFRAQAVGFMVDRGITQFLEGGQTLRAGRTTWVV